MANDDDDVVVLSDSDDEVAVVNDKNGRQNVATVGDGDDGDIEEVDVIPTTKSESGSVKSLTDEKGAESVSGGSTEDDMDGMQFIEAIMNTIPVAEAGPSGVNLSVGVNGNANEGDSSDAAGASSELLAKEQLRDQLENVFFKMRDVRGLTMNQRRNVKDKYLNHFDASDCSTKKSQAELVGLMDKALSHIERKKKAPWKTLDEILKCIKKNTAGNQRNPLPESNETEEERAERKKQEKIQRLEEALIELGKKINDFDNRVVDLDDETNSAYLIRSRLVRQYNKAYMTLCKETDSTGFTGRPIQKRLKLKDGITRFPELKIAVEKFINSKDYLFVPDYNDILKIVVEVSANSRPPLLAAEDVEETVQDLFKAIMRQLKFRRGKDFTQQVNSFVKEEQKPDFDENDPELLRKLEENAKLRKNEQQIIDRFAEVQEEDQEEPEEVSDDDADKSAPESDEDDDEKDEASDSEDQDKEGREQFKRDLIDDDEDDDDDEEDIEGPYDLISSEEPDNNENNELPIKKRKVEEDS